MFRNVVQVLCLSAAFLSQAGSSLRVTKMLRPALPKAPGFHPFHLATGLSVVPAEFRLDLTGWLESHAWL